MFFVARGDGKKNRNFISFFFKIIITYFSLLNEKKNNIGKNNIQKSSMRKIGTMNGHILLDDNKSRGAVQQHTTTTNPSISTVSPIIITISRHFLPIHARRKEKREKKNVQFPYPTSLFTIPCIFKI
jgi:hypothetical protein